MEMEVPDLPTCCSCLPLLYGLIAWGYVKLILGGLSLLVLIPAVVSYTDHILHDTFNIDGIVLLAYVLLVFVILDFISSIMLLAGAHTKSVGTLRSYKSFTIFLLGLFIIIFITDITLWCIYYDYYVVSYNFWFVLIVKCIVGFLYTVVQIHIIRLVKSDIIKLENYHEITWKSNAKANEAMAKCTLDMENKMYKL